MNASKRPIRNSFVLLTICFLTLWSCKSTKMINTGELDRSLSAKGIIRNHYNVEPRFKTLSGKMKIDYSDGENSQGVSVSLRLEKDKVIWLSAPLGIVKAYITPERVTFYNKLQNEYFDGDFTYISKLLGTDIDFNNLQNLLVGQALVDLREGKYAIKVVENNYQLKPRKSLELFKILFNIQPQNFKIASQQLSQPSEKRILEIQYKEYQQVGSQTLPNAIDIAAIQGTDKTTIAIDYRNLELNKSLRFPYKIPSGFKEIVLK